MNYLELFPPGYPGGKVLQRLALAIESRSYITGEFRDTASFGSINLDAFSSSSSNIYIAKLDTGSFLIPMLTATISASGATTFCQGDSVILTASSASTYLWSNGAITQSIMVFSSGNYSVTITNANGDSAISASTTITVNQLPAVNYTGLDTGYCINDAAVILSGTPSGGTFSGAGINSNQFAPVCGRNGIAYYHLFLY